MEIDFLGLNSDQSLLAQHETENKNSMTMFTDASGDISLSLSTSSPLDFQMGALGFHEKIVACSSNSYNTIKPCGVPVLAPTTIFYSSATTCFPYDLNDKPLDSRNISELSPTSSPFDPRNCSRAGYTPTVAMARKATLARFLEKRLHRLTQTKTSGFIKKSSTSPTFEACNMNSISYTKMRKKKNSSS